MEEDDSCGSLPNDAIGEGMVKKLSEEVSSMGENIRLQGLQVKSLEYVLKRAMEKIDRKIEELCRVQFRVLEKITELKSVENKVKAFSECVDSRTKLGKDKFDPVGVSTQESGQLPGRSPTPDNCKNEGPPRMKKDKKPLQKSGKGEVLVKVPEDKSGNMVLRAL